MKIKLLLLFLFFPLTSWAGDLISFLDHSQDIAGSLKVVMNFVAIALIPIALIMMTSFTRLIIIFSFLRQALGLSQLLPYQLLIGLSLLLTFFIMSSSFEKIYNKSLQPYAEEKISQKEALEEGFKPLKAFMLNQTRPQDLQLFQKLSKKQDQEEKNMALLPAFVLSELKTAFQIGFIIYIPFLIIDLVVAGLLMSMGMMALSPFTISLPLKIMLFLFVDGWSLLTDALVKSFY